MNAACFVHSGIFGEGWRNVRGNARKSRAGGVPGEWAWLAGFIRSYAAARSRWHTGMSGFLALTALLLQEKVLNFSGQTVE
ncbi:hypothetical protein PTR10_22305 [Serratia marcescens]|uniref:hypothetical protein n=1 Tax=Serratia marcescens TaxID=615 RepID=UPI00313B789D